MYKRRSTPEMLWDGLILIAQQERPIGSVIWLVRIILSTYLNQYLAKPSESSK